MEERVDAAKQLEEAMEGDDNIIVVDTMENLACDSYAALTERLYIVLNSMIVLEVTNVETIKIFRIIFSREELDLSVTI